MNSKFLKTQKILRLATIDSSGNPHIVPVWYMYKDNKIYIGTNTRTRKTKNIKKNSKVAFCVDIGINAPNIVGIMGTGKAKMILHETRVKLIAKKILRRYFSNLQNKSAQQLLDDTDCILEITLKKITEWRY